MSTALRFFAADEVHAALPWPLLVEALHRAFVQGANAPVRHAHALSDTETLLLMPAWRDERADADDPGAIGVKLVTVLPGAAARGGTTVAALYLLLDRATGAPRAVIDGEALTLRRTAAASALAARYLARADAATLLAVGAGRLAPWLVRAHCALRPALTRVYLWARNAAQAQTAAQELRDEGLPVEAVDDLPAACARADIVSCATTATAPVVHGAWLAPGTHLDLVGGFRPTMREVDDAALRGATLFVDTHAALAEAGDLADPLARGVIARGSVAADLADLVRGLHPGRRTREQITLFKSVGTALEDLAAAELVAA